MTSKSRLKILDIWVDPVSREEAIARVKNYLTEGTRPHSVLASNPEKFFLVPKDPTLYETYKNADLLLPDGIGIVLAVRALYGIDQKRIPGSEFIFDICNLSAYGGHGIFIYGAREEVNKKSVAILKDKYDGINIVGRSNGYVEASEMPKLIDRINASRAEVLFLALGSPRQEKWFASYKDSLKYVKVCQGIGGTLDTIGGNVKRAPEIWCRYNLEWLYRLLSDPKRIKRQIVLPGFVLLIMREIIKKRLNPRCSSVSA